MRQASSLERRGHHRHLDPVKVHQQHLSGVSPSAITLSRLELEHPARAPSGGVWWEEVEDVRARIERRRAVERAARQRRGLPPRRPASRRTVTITGRTALPVADGPLRIVEREASAVATDDTGAFPARRRKRTTVEWLGRSPDRIAAWAVALGFLLVLAGILSAH
jgi:hypothetical protein